MEDPVRNRAAAKLTKTILNTIYYHLSEPKFDLDEGEVKLVDHDESCLYFGLFEVDSDTGVVKSEPTLICTVEVFTDANGGR